MSSDGTPTGHLPAAAKGGGPVQDWRPVGLGRGWPAADPLAGSRLGATLQNVASIGARPVRPTPGPAPAGLRVPACLIQDGVTRVPPQAFVAVGRRGRALGSAPKPAGRLANDNSPRGPGRRPLWRDMIFLALLAATVAGAFYSGRLHAAQNVIVVPGPSSYRSMVT